MKKGDVKTFEYTGIVQTITLQQGLYRLECWGAAGGRGHGSTPTVSKGGYIKGEILIKKARTFYVVVGQEGNAGNSRRSSFNGGGVGGWDTWGGAENGGSGGGASDIRTFYTSNVLAKDSLESRIIVAGGAGGNGGWRGCQGGAGGNLNQSTYQLGIGAPGINNQSGGGGGGAGYYGGNTNGSHWDQYWVGNGAFGGTSFASKELKNVVERPDQRSGDGLVKITCLGGIYYLVMVDGKLHV